GNDHVLVNGEIGDIGHRVAARSANDDGVGARIGSADAGQDEVAGSLASERGTALEPLIIQSSTRRIDIEAGSRPWAVGDALRRRGNNYVLVNHEVGDIGGRVAAGAAD